MEHKSLITHSGKINGTILIKQTQKAWNKLLDESQAASRQTAGHLDGISPGVSSANEKLSEI